MTKCCMVLNEVLFALQGAQPALSAPPGAKSQSVQRPVGSVSQNNLQITSPNAAQPPSQIGSQPAPPAAATDRKPASFDLLGELGGDPFASPAPSSQPQGEPCYFKQVPRMPLELGLAAILSGNVYVVINEVHTIKMQYLLYTRISIISFCFLLEFA